MSDDPARLGADELLTTTRAVRRKLDLHRPVEPQVLQECVRIALHAPNGSNMQPFSFVIVTDAAKRAALARLYRDGFVGSGYGTAGSPTTAHLLGADGQEVAEFARIKASAYYLADHLHEVPVHVIPCLHVPGWRTMMEQTPSSQQNLWLASMYGSALPAVWSFMLACRARGLGTVWTTGHLHYEVRAAEILGIPHADVAQLALIPVAYTIGNPFGVGPRRCVDVHPLGQLALTACRLEAARAASTEGAGR